LFSCALAFVKQHNAINADKIVVFRFFILFTINVITGISIAFYICYLYFEIIFKGYLFTQ